jgi:hypothetical protein
LLGAAWWAGEKPVPAVEPPETAGTPVLLAEGPDRPRDAARPGPRSEPLIGTFEAPEEVPAYKVLDDQRDGRDGARAARLLVDTRSRSQGDFVQITRHIKARYSGLDAVSVEFIDLTGRYGYHGGALIFNTVAGATYIGYIYGPPNNRGYYVSATD